MDKGLIDEEDLGTHKISMLIVDEYGAKSAEYSFNFIVTDITFEGFNGVVIPEDQEVNDVIDGDRVLSAKISEITYFGWVTILFNATMRTHNIDLKDINDTVLEIYTAPVQERIYDADFNLSKHNFTWETKSFKERELKLKLHFDYPLVHSPLPE